MVVVRLEAGDEPLERAAAVADQADLDRSAEPDACGIDVDAAPRTMWIVTGPGTMAQSNELARRAETTACRSAPVPPSRT